MAPKPILTSFNPATEVVTARDILSCQKFKLKTVQVSKRFELRRMSGVGVR